jgi:hypothetical protein
VKAKKHNIVVGIVRANHTHILSTLLNHSSPLKKGIARMALKPNAGQPE